MTRILPVFVALLIGLYFAESCEAQFLRNAARNTRARQNARFAEAVQRQNVAALNANFAALNSCGHVAAVQAVQFQHVPVVQQLNVQTYTVPTVQAVAVPTYSQAFVAPVVAPIKVQQLNVQKARASSCSQFFGY